MSKKKSLSDDEISTSSFKGRRSFVRSLGAIGLTATALALGTRVATASDPRPDNDYDSSRDGALPDKKEPRDRD